jgi:nucleotide-binding universal stress UspA family protein
MKTIKRILIAIDFSEDARTAARWGINLAKQLEADVLAVTVLDVGDLRVAMDAGLHGFETQEDVKRQVQEWIDAEYAKIIPPTAKVRREIRRGIVEKELVAAVRSYDADLVVMGSKGLGGRGPIGGKAKYLLEHCQVPVALTQSSDER